MNDVDDAPERHRDAGMTGLHRTDSIDQVGKLAPDSGRATPMELFDYEMDVGRQSLTILGSRPQMIPLPRSMQISLQQSNIERVTVRPEAGRVILRLPGDVEATVELAFGRTVPELLARRTVVYLDQNHWSTLSAWQNGDARVSAVDAEAAARLVELVETGKILLPISGAHLVETTPLYGAPRVALANTVLTLSRGWQMRNPVHVRTEELRRAIEGLSPAVAEHVFAPAADEIFASTRRADFSDLPPPFGELSAEVVSVLALYGTVVDPAAISIEGGKAAAEAWATDWQRVARLLRDDGVTGQGVADVAHARLLADVVPELLVVGSGLGFGPDEVIARLLDESDRVGSMPYLGRAQGILARRMQNTTQSWKGNHLIDIHFLSCAAGYADLVIGERQTIDYLQRDNDVPRGAALAKTLPEGMALLGGQ